MQVRRIKLGIPKPDLKFRPWTAGEEKLLGTAPDPVIAGRIDRQPATVAARRHLLGIPPAPYVAYNA